MPTETVTTAKIKDIIDEMSNYNENFQAELSIPQENQFLVELMQRVKAIRGGGLPYPME